MSEDAPTCVIVDVLRRQVRPTLAMFRAASGDGAEAVWSSDASPAYWEHAYHALFGLGFFLREPFVPYRDAPKPAFHARVSPDLEPTEADPIPLADYEAYRREVFEQLEGLLDRLTPELLTAETAIFGRYFTLADRLLGQVRHVQHHIGELNAIRRRHGVEPIAWQGYNEGEEG